MVGRFLLRSNSLFVRAVPATSLRSIPYAQNSAAGCDRSLVEAKTPGGKWARARGWRVADEQPLGDLTAIVVLQRYEYGTGMCIAIDGGIVLFDGDRMIAAFMAAPGQLLSIGEIEVTDRGALRVETGSNDLPFADIVVHGNRIDVVPLPLSETACHGQLSFPNVIGSDIRTARNALRRAGWVPVKNSPLNRDKDDLGVLGFTDEGFGEVTYCSPRSQCGFQYHQHGRTIQIITGASGNDNIVYTYEVDCAGKIMRRADAAETATPGRSGRLAVK